MASIQKNPNVLRELMELINDGEDFIQPEEVEAVLKRGIPHALRAQLDVIMGGENERVRSHAAEQWLNRSGYAPVQKVAVKQQLSLILL